MSLSKSRFVRSKKKSRKKNRKKIKNHTEKKNGGGPSSWGDFFSDWTTLRTEKIIASNRAKDVSDRYKNYEDFFKEIKKTSYERIKSSEAFYKAKIKKNTCRAGETENCLKDEEPTQLKTELKLRLLERDPAYKNYQLFLSKIKNTEREDLKDEELEDLKKLYERAIKAYTCDDDETENCLKGEDAEKLNRFLDE